MEKVVKHIDCENPGKPYNEMYFINITFKDGYQGQAIAKSNPPHYNIGDTLIVEEKPGSSQSGFQKIKVSKPSSRGSGGEYKRSSKHDSIGETIGCLAHCVSRMVSAGKIELGDFSKEVYRLSAEVIKVQEKLKEKNKPVTQQSYQTPQTGDSLKPIPVPEPKPKQPAPPVQDDDDVPF